MNYLQIDNASISNGPGVRVVLWVSGCSVRCKGCQNPESWDYASGKVFDEAAKNKVLDALGKSYVRGITLSGGNPLEDCCLSDVLELIQTIRSTYKNKDIWLYTGWMLEDIMSKDEDITDRLRQRIICMCDVVVDGPYIEAQRDLTLPFCGSTNQRLIDVKETFKHGEIIQYKIN